MPEEKVSFRTEGQPAFPTESTGGEKPAGSQPENKPAEVTPNPADGDNKNVQPPIKEDIPFHDHPRWKERESNWEKRFNDQESRHQEDLKTIREEFGQKRQDNADTEIPDWFGGNAEQWAKYVAHEDKKIAAAEERAVKRLEEKQTKEKSAIDDANKFFANEVEAIESDKTLNPTGIKVDPEKLLKTVMDYELVDTKGRWNYRAGFRMMQNQPASTIPKPDLKSRKDLANATNSGNDKPESKPQPFKTAQDFKGPNRPW